MTDLWLLRHGPTKWNEERRLQGRTDQPLSENGRERVRAWRLPAELPRDARWVSSPLSRARDTATLLGHPDAAVDQRLIELDWGEWEGLTLGALRAEEAEDLARRESKGLDFRPPGGESYREVQTRVAPFLTDVAHSRRSTVAVCHKGVILALQALATGWDMIAPPRRRIRLDTCHRMVLSDSGRPTGITLNLPLLPG